MSKRIKILLFPLVVLCTAVETWSSPIVGSSANTLPKGKFMFEGHTLLINFSSIYDENISEWTDLPDDSTFNIYLFLPQFYYGISDWLTVRLTVPVKLQNQKFDVSKESKGISDIVLDTKCRFVKGAIISGFTGIRFPTGNTEADIPLGDGSTDFVGGLLLTKRVMSVIGNITLGYWLNGKSNSGTQLDNTVFYNITAENPMFNKWAFVLELDGSKEGDKYIFQLCPGVYNKSFKGLTLEAALEIPVLAKHGLKYKFAPWVGLIYIF